MKAFEFATRQAWAIQRELHEDGEWRSAALDNILKIAQRAHEPDFEAVVMKQMKRMDERGMRSMRSDVAVIEVSGPIFRHANLMTRHSGATSIEDLGREFQSALDDDAVKSIILNVDSPGGAVAGVSEFAQAVYEARGKKKVTAYVDGLGASAAYWIASAAERVVVSETAELGSIGVMMTIVNSADKAGAKSYTLISSQSPNKNKSIETDEGRAALQQRVDDLAEVFISNVARNRGVSAEEVKERFGAGHVMIGSRAVAAGMVDAIGTFEALISSLETKRSSGLITLGGSAANSTKGGPVMDPVTSAEQTATVNPTVDTEAIRKQALAEGKKLGAAESVAAERARIAAIIGCDEAKGREELARTFALETDTSVEVTKKLLAAAPKVEEQKPAENPLAAAMKAVENPGVGADTGSTEATDEAFVKRVLYLTGNTKEAK